MKKVIISLSALILASTVVAAQDMATMYRNQIAKGTWVTQFVDEDRNGQKSTETIRVHFDKDGRYQSFCKVGNTQLSINGEWKISDQSLSISNYDDPDEHYQIISIDKNKMILQSLDDGEQISFVHEG